MKKTLLLIFMSVLIFFSCEKEISIDLPDPESKYVIEGWIEQDQYAGITITKNSSYFSKVDSSSLSDIFILDAEVYISDGVVNEKLELDFSNIITGVWPFIFYKGSNLKGEVGKSYYLTIYVGNDTITGMTTIPSPVELDSIWWEPDTIGKPENTVLGYIWAKYSDNPNENNYFRLLTKRLNRDNTFVPLFGSVYEDVYFKGKTFTFSLYRGIQSLSDRDAINEDEEILHYKKGDTVIVKIASIDKEHYDFWRTIEQENYSGGNPFVYPVLIRHNVNGALGVFGGYGATYYTLIIGD